MSDSLIRRELGHLITLWRGRADNLERGGTQVVKPRADQWRQAAQDLESLLARVRTDKPRGAACINCGEAHDGGYVSGREGDINEGAVGPFCSQCWEFLSAMFIPAAPQEKP